MNENNFISEDEIERAIDFLRDNAETAGRLRATRVYTEEFRKSLKSLLMKEHVKAPLAAQEREAYADPRYLEHLEAMREAVFQDEKNRALRAAAEIKIAAWQTMNANWRAMKI